MRDRRRLLLAGAATLLALAVTVFAVRFAGGERQAKQTDTVTAPGQRNDPKEPSPDPYAWPGQPWTEQWPQDVLAQYLPTKDAAVLVAVRALFDPNGTRRLELARIGCREQEYWRFTNAVDRVWDQSVMSTVQVRARLADFPDVVPAISEPDTIEWLPSNTLGVRGDEHLLARVHWQTKPDVPNVAEVRLMVNVQGPPSDKPDQGWCFRQFGFASVWGDSQ